MRFDAKQFYHNPSSLQCYDCLTKCDYCNIYCDDYLCGWVSTENNKCESYYYPGCECSYCGKMVCIFCANIITLYGRSIFTNCNISCDDCIKKCKKCDNILNEYYTYKDCTGDEYCSTCDLKINESVRHCQKCDICLDCIIPGLEETL